MSVHRRRLALAFVCPQFEAAPGTASGDGGFCTRCRKHVHDLSEMTEGAARRLLAAHAGAELCVSYRVAADGRVRFAPTPVPSRSALAMVTLLLTACAGYVTESELPLDDPVCTDAAGFEIACADAPSTPAMPAVPMVDGPGFSEVAPLETEAVGRTDGRMPELARDTVPVGGVPTGVGCPLPTPHEVEPAGTHARVSFSVDSKAAPLRGIIAIPADGWIERDFVPTAVLIEEAKARRAERRRRRRARRAVR